MIKTIVKKQTMASEEHVKLTRENIAQVIELFTGIDNKIVELHQISAKDFLGFNDLLKEYYQKSRQITKTTHELFDYFCNLDHHQFVDHSQVLLDASNQKTKNIKRISIQVLDGIKRTQEDMAQLFVPFNNFRQNLMTLKFLFANVKLAQWISDPVSALEISRLADHITSHIQNTKDGLPSLDSDIQILSGQMTVLFQYIQTLINDVLPEVEKHSLELEQTLSNIRQIKNKAVEDNRKIEELNQRCSKNLDNIITNLQYHDIIRQKMEHIQSTHKTIIDDLIAVEDNEQYEINSIKYIKQIPDIAEIQAAQLMFTNKEYQNAIETIAQKLLETGNDLNTISVTCNNRIVNLPKIEDLIITLGDTTVKLQTHFFKLSELAVKLTTSCAYYQDKIEEQVTKKIELQDIEEKLSELSMKIKNIKRNETIQIDVFTKQIEPMLQDIHNSRLRMENLIPDAQHSTIRAQILSLAEQITITGFPSKQNVDSSKIEMIHQLKNIKEIIKKADNIDSSELKQSIEKVVYYDVFDHEVEKITESLNKIYLMLVPYNNSTKMSKDLLTNMEALYTMQSQRDIHSKIKSETEGQSEETDIELF